MASIESELGFREFAPEPFPQLNRPRERDDVWVRVWSYVQFVPFGIFV